MEYQSPDAGQVIGWYLGRPIPAFLIITGRRCEFLRVARTSQDGCVDLDQLADNEFIISPGLIYG